MRPTIERTKSWTYHVTPEGGDTLELPSVTTIIGNTVPKELTWYGMKVGIQGMLSIPSADYISVVKAADPVERALEILKARKLTTYHKMNKAAQLGRLVHSYVEEYAKGNTEVFIDGDADAQRRVNAFNLFVQENKPEFLQSEIMTCSLQYGYAGTLDTRVKFHAGRYAGATALADYKNSNNIYVDQYFPQLEAYEQAEVECGEDPTDLRCVVRLCDDGTYEMRYSEDTIDDFLILFEHWKSMKARKEREKIWKKAEKIRNG